MARADLILELIKFGLTKDYTNYKKAAEALCAEERTKQHKVLANKIQDLLSLDRKKTFEINSVNFLSKSEQFETNLFWEKFPQKSIDRIILPDSVKDVCQGMIEEQLRAELLQSYGVEPRNKLLLIGPPGNGKTSLAEAIAEALMVPLLTIRYESIVGAYLGETAQKLSRLFEIIKTKKCVVFFDEFETLGKDRGDAHETGEIKRVVSSLLLQIDSLPSYVVAIAATNHDSLLDKAAWRRFQIKVNLPKPTKKNLEEFFYQFQKERDFDFGVLPSTLANKTLGLSYAEAEELALEIYRQYILNFNQINKKEVVNKVIGLWQSHKINLNTQED